MPGLEDSLKGLFVLVIITLVMLIGFDPILASSCAAAEISSYGSTKNILYIISELFALHIDLIFLWLG